MKVVILAGGYGTRLSEVTELIPKPMVPIGGRPMLWHIMHIYASQGFKDFVIALGYKSEVVKNYFNNFYTTNSDFTIELGTGHHHIINKPDIDWKVTLVYTGLHTGTGGRMRRLAPHLGNEPFFMTYGDGVSNVDLKKELAFHKNHGKLVTMTVVHPPERFGTLEIKPGRVAFREKSQIDVGWINGGFFVVQPEAIKHIKDDSVMFEREPLMELGDKGELVPFEHEGFWQCMDMKRDVDYLEKLWDDGKAPWKIW